LNARHVAISEHIAQRAVGVPQVDAFRHASATWGELSPRAKARARAVAREKNTRARLMKKGSTSSINHAPNDAPSPWHVADGSAWHLTAGGVGRAMAEPAGVQRRARAWAHRDGDAPRCGPSLAFPDAAPPPPATVAALHGLAADVRARVVCILQLFAAIFARVGLKQHEAATVAMTCPVLVVQAGGSLHGLIQRCSCLKSSPFMGEFVVYDICPGGRRGAVAEAPFVATLPRAPLRARAFGATPLAVPLQTETELAVEMAEIWAGAWIFSPCGFGRHHCGHIVHRARRGSWPRL